MIQVRCIYLAIFIPLLLIKACAKPVSSHEEKELTEDNTSSSTYKPQAMPYPGQKGLIPRQLLENGQVLLQPYHYSPARKSEGGYDTATHPLNPLRIE